MSCWSDPPQLGLGAAGTHALPFASPWPCLACLRLCGTHLHAQLRMARSFCGGWEKHTGAGFLPSCFIFSCLFFSKTLLWLFSQSAPLERSTASHGQMPAPQFKGIGLLTAHGTIARVSKRQEVGSKAMKYLYLEKHEITIKLKGTSIPPQAVKLGVPFQGRKGGQ